MSSIGITKDIDELLNQHHLLDKIIGPIDKYTKDILFAINASQKHLLEHASVFNQNLIDPFYKSLENVHFASASILKSFKIVSEEISLTNYNAVAKFANIVPPKEVLTLASEMKTSLTQYANIALEAEKSSAHLLTNNFLNSPAINSILGLQIDFQNKYGELNKTILTKDYSKNVDPLTITKFSSTELLLSNRLFENTFIPNATISSFDKDTKAHIKKKSNDVISEKLSKLSPSLLKTLNGAREAIYSKNEDKYRHVVSSYREVIKKLIFILAPVDQVKRWATNPIYYCKDRPKTPTYDAHIHFLAKDINPKEFADFYIVDNKLITKQIRILDDLNHSDDPSKKIDNLESLSLRVEHYLTFLLQFAC